MESIFNFDPSITTLGKRDVQRELMTPLLKLAGRIPLDLLKMRRKMLPSGKREGARRSERY